MEYTGALAGLILGTANPAFQEKGLRYVLDQSSAVALFLVEDFRGNPIAYIGHEAMRPLKA
jgi:fatty-acyl-CoA synthase